MPYNGKSFIICIIKSKSGKGCQVIQILKILTTYQFAFKELQKMKIASKFIWLWTGFLCSYLESTIRA